VNPCTANRHYNRGDFSDRCRFGCDGGAEIHSLASAKKSALGEETIKSVEEGGLKFTKIIEDPATVWSGMTIQKKALSS
jgi:hypothetical protein